MPEGVRYIYTLYIGVQAHDQQRGGVAKTEQLIETFLNDEEGKPIAVDVMRVTNGFDIENSKVWVAYWTNFEEWEKKIRRWDPKQLWEDLGSAKKSIGVWSEQFLTELDRLETNYASLRHQPGIAQVPGAEFPAHNLTGYWGSGRDRLPGSKDDLY